MRSSWMAMFASWWVEKYEFVFMVPKEFIKGIISQFYNLFFLFFIVEIHNLLRTQFWFIVFIRFGANSI